ncbi:cell wall-associated NlpC family hydrolase [Saccharothrix ecbatanensis]|uniref:Cell wall-associated NlpC family hydrolase n=1 Tax=Saccharothrix ecbatanensis TaxID=1105145 RepID=A0A7W9HKB4_9PSEU|nr:NlpC/P60 family protein [Saccharothrix ecbatanensis]MBB5803409.1 cell wall-associated NlpC family hydrolase [Saccharothrix ecbatanensis]
MSSTSAQRTIRAALAATAAAVVSVGVVAPQAAADPAVPANASEALKKYTELAGQAEKLNEEHLRAQDDLKAKQSELDKANSDLTGARQAEENLRGQVDLLTEASFEGARFNQLSALLVSDSQQDYLNRMSALGILAADNAETLASLSKAVTDADDAQRRATDAAGAATKIVDDIAQRKSDLDKQVADARAQYKQLSSADKAILSNPGDTSRIAVPAGTAGKALEYALAQRGDPYVFGANGPDAWDCSSLMQQSYRTAGVSIPRTSYGQAGVGRQVSRGEVKAGDLIIYYADQHHVAMAVDGVRAVHASTEGVPVKIADIDSIGPINVIRRIEG